MPWEVCKLVVQTWLKTHRVFEMIIPYVDMKEPKVKRWTGKQLTTKKTKMEVCDDFLLCHSSYMIQHVNISKHVGTQPHVKHKNLPEALRTKSVQELVANVCRKPKDLPRSSYFWDILTRLHASIMPAFTLNPTKASKSLQSAALVRQYASRSVVWEKLLIQMRT